MSSEKLKIIIGLPGDNFSQAFLLSWTRLMDYLIKSDKYDIAISPGKSSYVTFARMQTLGLNVLRGKNQKAFNGEEYDVFVTIDSDIVFTPAQFVELVESTKIHPVVAGYYMMQDGKHFAVVKNWDKEYFIKNGTFQFFEQQDLEPYMRRFEEQLASKQIGSPEFLQVSYAGMGFFACRKAVLDNMKYPFFNSKLQKIVSSDGLELEDLCSEDVAFCKNIQKAGYDIMLNTRLRVGHEKRVIL